MPYSYKNRSLTIFVDHVTDSRLFSSNMDLSQRLWILNNIYNISMRHFRFNSKVINLPYATKHKGYNSTPLTSIPKRPIMETTSIWSFFLTQNSCNLEMKKQIAKTNNLIAFLVYFIDMRLPLVKELMGQ